MTRRFACFLLRFAAACALTALPLSRAPPPNARLAAANGPHDRRHRRVAPPAPVVRLLVLLPTGRRLPATRCPRNCSLAAYLRAAQELLATATKATPPTAAAGASVPPQGGWRRRRSLAIISAAQPAQRAPRSPNSAARGAARGGAQRVGRSVGAPGAGAFAPASRPRSVHRLAHVVAIRSRLCTWALRDVPRAQWAAQAAMRARRR